MNDETQGSHPPILSFRTYQRPARSARPYAMMAIVVVCAAVVNGVWVAVNPFGVILGTFWLDVLTAVVVPVVMWRTRPGAIHWAAYVVFVIIMIGMAVLSLAYVAAVAASV